MLTIDILIKSIVLLYRDSLNSNNTLAGSKALVKKLLDTDKKYNKRKKLGKGTDYLEDIVDMIYELLDQDGPYDSTSILESFSIISSDVGNESKYDVLEKMLKADLDQTALSRSIVTLKSMIDNFQKDMELKWLIKIANIEINNVTSGKDLKTYVLDIVTKIQNLVNATGEVDPAVQSEFDLTNQDGMTDALNQIKKARSDNVLVTGFKGLNKMLQGGFRRHELWNVFALQHNYKSGFLQTLFCQFCMLNKPKLKDPTKKPMIMYISFEDDPHIYLEQMYKYIYYSEFRKNPDINNTDPSEISKYLINNLTRNGYTPYTLRADPTSWSIDKMFDKVNVIMSEGYEIHAVIIDYLTKLPTTGCDRSGPQGTDVRDMFQRVKSFFGKREIACITAHQLSTDAVMLKRQNYTGEMFLKELVGKGYTELSKQIPHILDGELYMCIENKGSDENYLCFQRGKHRIPTRISEKDMFFKIKFPDHQAPIPEDINQPDEDEDLNGLDSSMKDLGLV